MYRFKGMSLDIDVFELMFRMSTYKYAIINRVSLIKNKCIVCF